MEEERLSLLQRLRERHERINNLCYWLGNHWEDVVLYTLITIIIVLLVITVWLMMK